MKIAKPYNPLNGGRYSYNSTEKPRVRIPTDKEVAWLSGLWEGEGCWYISKARVMKQKSKNNVPYLSNPALKMVITMTDYDIMERISLIMDNRKCTEVRSASKVNPNRKTQWYINLQGSAAIEWTNRMLPYLGERRVEKYYRILDEVYGIKQKPFLIKEKEVEYINPLAELLGV